jgi:hypothetical protein
MEDIMNFNADLARSISSRKNNKKEMHDNKMEHLLYFLKSLAEGGSWEGYIKEELDLLNVDTIEDLINRGFGVVGNKVYF